MVTLFCLSAHASIRLVSYLLHLINHILRISTRGPLIFKFFTFSLAKSGPRILHLRCMLLLLFILLLHLL